MMKATSDHPWLNKTHAHKTMQLTPPIIHVMKRRPAPSKTTRVGSVVVLILLFAFVHLMASFSTPFLYQSSDVAEIEAKMNELSPGASSYGWLDEESIQSLARPWNATTNEDWCVPHQKTYKASSPSVHGLVYVKIPKAASSTSSGVNLRIAHRVGEALLTNSTRKVCAHTREHWDPFWRRQPPYLLWTTIRDPSKRALSQFFHFEVSRNGRAPKTKNMIEFLNWSKSYQLRFVTANDESYLKKTPPNPIEFIQTEVMSKYNFIGLVERWDETLVLMKLLWGLGDGDIIVLSAKQSGGYDDGQFKKHCFQIQQALTNVKVDDYIRQNFTVNNLDYLLYAAVNRSMDLTIDLLGRELVQEEVAKHRQLKRLVEEHCLENVIFPCSPNGTRQIEEASKNCRWVDSECGYPCVDKVLEKHNLDGTRRFFSK